MVFDLLFAAEFANLPLIPAYFEIGTDKFLHGVNFASSGSGCLVETNRGIVSGLLIFLFKIKLVSILDYLSFCLREELT